MKVPSLRTLRVRVAGEAHDRLYLLRFECREGTYRNEDDVVVLAFTTTLVGAWRVF